MQPYNVELPFSIGKFKVELTLDGQYDRLDSQSEDTLRAATVASLLQLPHWIQNYTGSEVEDRGNQSSRRQTDANTATCKIENGNGQIMVRLQVDTTRNQIPQQFTQMVANAIAASVQNHADSALIGTPATNDAFVQIQRYLATRQLTATGSGFGQH